jgi:hypothetical protein
MSGIDVAEFKAVFPGLKAKQRIRSGPHAGRTGGQRPQTLRADDEALRAFYQKAGVNVSKLEEIAAQTRDDARRRLEAEKSAAAERMPASLSTLKQWMANRATAQKLLAKPFLSYYEIIPKPFLIWETPKAESGVFVNSQIENNFSWLKAFVETTSRSDDTHFTFYFYWQNPSEYYALMNVDSWLILNGACEVVASQGLFSSDNASAQLITSLAIWRWMGWGTDPMTGANLDQTELTSTGAEIMDLSVSGSNFGFGTTTPQSQNFQYAIYNLNYNFLAVPPGASVLFEVGVEIGYGFRRGGQDGDYIYIDFANDNAGYQIICTEVGLEMLTGVETLNLR